MYYADVNLWYYADMNLWYHMLLQVCSVWASICDYMYYIRSHALQCHMLQPGDVLLCSQDCC
jgi:hypothetical protein